MAEEQLEQQWKAWIAQDDFKARREAATRAQAAAEIPIYEQFTAFMFTAFSKLRSSLLRLLPATQRDAPANTDTGYPGPAIQFLAAGHKEIDSVFSEIQKKFRTIQKNSEQIQTEFRQNLDVFRQNLDDFRQNLEFNLDQFQTEFR